MSLEDWTAYLSLLQESEALPETGLDVAPSTAGNGKLSTTVIAGRAIPASRCRDDLARSRIRASPVPTPTRSPEPRLGLAATDARHEASDEQLVNCSQNGDARAFELLVIKYQNKTIQIAGRIVGDSDAPDVAQETFIKAYRSIRGFRGESSFSTWLHRIAINTAKNHLLARRRRPSNQDIDITDAERLGHAEALADRCTPEAKILAEEVRIKVTRATNRLSPNLRRAIVLRELEGLSYEEIAEAMGCPVGTVRSRIFRARDAIDAVVQPLLG